MKTKYYVSLEVSKLLKEKGYKGVCSSFITEDCYEIDKIDKDVLKHTNNVNRTLYPCPTIHEAAKWLRETHDIHIVVSPHYSRKYEIIEYKYRIATYFDLLEKPNKWKKSKEYYEKYEQCLNDAILEALKLIDYENHKK